MNVYLSGMIGSGKTVIGARLAAMLGRPFVDLDREMDRELGYSFHRLVAERGWVPFRELEYAIVKRFATMRDVVAALGGGTMRYAWNRDALAGTGLVVLLEADLRTLADRVRAADRPRVNPGVSLEEDLMAIEASAGEIYRASGDVVYRTDAGQAIEEEAAELAVRLAPQLGLRAPAGRGASR